MRSILSIVKDLLRPSQKKRFQTLLDADGVKGDIFSACIEGDLRRVCDLLAEDNGLANRASRFGSLLRLAAEYGRSQVAAVLIDHGAALNIPATGFENLPLHLAARGGHANVVGLLIERGADVNARDRNKQTALHYAAERRGGKETVSILIDGGADPEVRDVEDLTALQIALARGNLPVFEALISYGADVNARAAATASSWTEDPSRWPLVEDATSARPLYQAVCSGSVRNVELLLDAGADIDAVSFGWSSLHAAAAKPDVDMARLLLARGADLHVKSADNRTPIELLAGHRRSAELLKYALRPD